MSKLFVWRPREFRTGPVDGVDLSFPIGIGTEMYFYVGDDEEGNAMFDQVGTIAFPEPNNKKVYEVNYYPEFEGPRENESESSKQERAGFLENKGPEEEVKPETTQAETEATTEAAPEAGGESTSDGGTD